MNSSPDDTPPLPEVEWTANLEFQHEGQLAAVLRSDPQSCTFEITGRRGLMALGQLPRQGILPKAPESVITQAAGLLPTRINLTLGGINIGHFEPRSPVNDWSRRLGLPFGRLTVHTLALARALLLGG